MSEGEKMDELDAVYKELGESEIIRRNQMAQVVALEHERDEWKDKFETADQVVKDYRAAFGLKEGQSGYDLIEIHKSVLRELEALNGLRAGDIDSFTTRIEQLERISADKALRLIKDEISWSKKNKSDAASADFENGFIKGLEQAKFLINKIINQF